MMKTRTGPLLKFLAIFASAAVALAWPASAVSPIAPAPSVPGWAQTQTLGSAVASITFTVPSGYTNLRIIFTGRGSVAAVGIGLKLRFNGDSGANYQDQNMSASDSGAPSAEHSTSTTTITCGNIPAASTAANYAGVTVIDIPNYLGGFYKELTARSSYYIGFQNVRIYGGTWKNTAPITSITLLVESGNLLAGTSATLLAE